MRQGQFTRNVVEYGNSMSFVRPSDNDPGSYLLPELSLAMELSLAQAYDLQARINDLYAIFRGERDYYASTT